MGLSDMLKSLMKRDLGMVQEEVSQEVEEKIQEIREKGAKFQQKKLETRDILLETAESIDRVIREDTMGTVGTTGVSMVGGVLTVIGGVLTIATMGAAAPLLIAGTAVGVAGGLGGITKNILVGKKKMQTSAETAMENLRRLEEEFKQVVIDLCLEMEAMTADQKRATQQMLALTKNTSVRNSVKSVREDDAFKKMGATKGYKKDAVGTATLVLGVSARTVAREFSEEVLEMSAKSFGKAAGGLMVGVGALFLVSDGVTITKSAMRLWKQEPSKAADMLRDLAGKLELEEEQAAGEGGRVTDLSCPICWDSLTCMDDGRTVLSTPCGHLFCSSCISSSISSSSSCPTCRARISLKTCNRIYL